MKGLLTILLVLVVASLKAQVETDVLTKTLQFEKDNPANVLYVTNINGSIDVEGYNGSEIQIEVKRTIKANPEPPKTKPSIPYFNDIKLMPVSNLTLAGKLANMATLAAALRSKLGMIFASSTDLLF